MRTSAVRNRRTLIQKPWTIRGQERAKLSASRNDRWTCGQPGALTTTIVIAVKTTIVETTATATARPPSPPRP